MKGNVTADPGPAVTTQPGEVDMFDGPDVHNSTAVDGDNQELFGYVQDNFEFLDHMDCSSSYQVCAHSPPKKNKQKKASPVELYRQLLPTVHLCQTQICLCLSGERVLRGTSWSLR